MYPLGIAGGPGGVAQGPPDDFGQIGAALADLAGDGPPLLVRLYVSYSGDAEAALAQVAQFAQIGPLVDLCLSYHDPGGDVSRWCSFAERVVARHGSQVGSISVTNEANLTAIPVVPDGAYPNAPLALAEGLVAAARARHAAGAAAALGFTAGSEAGPGAGELWARLDPRFASAVEFAGLTVYPGDFGPRVVPPAARPRGGRHARRLPFPAGGGRNRVRRPDPRLRERLARRPRPGRGRPGRGAG
ncbi:MAG TPA: hypothetical protein VH478_17425, partial [Trebonia sp.]|nr:hypothetical protein [Trebonia sp.]